MATSRQRRKPSSNAKGGSTLFGILVGLIIGLAAAAAVAYFVTQVPMPFVDKASRDPAQTLLPDVRDAPDPNTGLYGPNGPAGRPATGPTATLPTPLPPTAQPSTPTSPSNQDDIGALLATLGSAAQSAAPASSSSPATTPAAPTASPKPTPPAAKPAAPATTATTYYLQAGAFRTDNDAQAVRARILLMGLPAQVHSAQVNGTQWYRVRVGPFKGIDEMNRSRVQLSEAKIESTVVRP